MIQEKIEQLNSRKILAINRVIEKYFIIFLSINTNVKNYISNFSNNKKNKYSKI